MLLYFLSMIKNETPYIGKIKLKFEKYPHYRGSQSGMLNKVHLNLGFTKLVSRMYPNQTLEGGPSNIDSKKIELIEKYTGGIIGTHKWGNNEEFVLENSFLTKKGEYIGDIETGWWYYNSNLVVCEDYPHGVAIQLKENNYFKKYDRTYHSSDLNLDGDAVGYYGYTHRGGSLFKIGDRLFNEDYKPVRSDYTQLEWDKYYEKYQKSLKKSDDFDKKWMEEDGIGYVMPFNRRGSKTITMWNEAKEAATNMSKYLG